MLLVYCVCFCAACSDACHHGSPHVSLGTLSGRIQDMATSTPVRIPIPSARPALGWQDRLQRCLLLDRSLGYLFLLPALLVILVLVAYPFANAIVMTFQNKIAGVPGRSIGLANYR